MHARITGVRLSRNPHSGAAIINYTIAGNAGYVTMQIFDARGGLVAEPVNDDRTPGSYTAVWQGENRQGERAAAGIYFLRMQIGNEQYLIRRLRQLY